MCNRSKGYWRTKQKKNLSRRILQHDALALFILCESLGDLHQWLIVLLRIKWHWNSRDSINSNDDVFVWFLWEPNKTIFLLVLYLQDIDQCNMSYFHLPLDKEEDKNSPSCLTTRRENFLLQKSTQHSENEARNQSDLRLLSFSCAVCCVKANFADFLYF